MKKYNEMFKKINNETISSVKLMIDNGFFRDDDKMKFSKLDELNMKLSNIYKIPKPSLTLMSNYFGVGGYNECSNAIYINKPSLVTFLHEFKHALLFNKNKVQSEPLARGWSHSVYFLASPDNFNRALNKGLLIYQDANGNRNEEKT